MKEITDNKIAELDAKADETLVAAMNAATNADDATFAKANNAAYDAADAASEAARLRRQNS